MNRCTWMECVAAGTRPQLDKHGAQWACLCVDHDLTLVEAIESGDAKRTMGAWVRAQGGPTKATERMGPAIKAGARLIDALAKARK